MDPTQLQQLGLTEDQIAQLMQLGVLQEEKGITSKELEMAQQLRQTPGPRGRYSGRSFIAPNPMEYLGRGIDRIRGSYESQQATERMRENAQKQASLRQQFLQALLKGQQQQRPASPQVPGATPGIMPQQPTAQGMFPMMGGGR